MGRPYACDMSDDDFELDDEYFAQTYRPLSNLPTPPLSSASSSAVQSPQPGVDDGETLESEFLGPAVHLANMLPPAASLATPSVALVQAILSRAQLPLDTIALAVCILDSLDSRFARSWRLACPLSATTTTGCPLTPEQQPCAPASKRHTLPAGGTLPQQQHIDAVSPEVIAVAALMIAAKFTEDRQDPTRHYAWAWGRGTWSCAQLNFTERCVMENLRYRILPLADGDVLADARADMARAGRIARRERREREHVRAASAGVMVGAGAGAALGFELTPPVDRDDDGLYGSQTQASFCLPPPICLRLPVDGGRR